MTVRALGVYKTIVAAAAALLMGAAGSAVVFAQEAAADGRPIAARLVDGGNADEIVCDGAHLTLA